MLDVNPKKLRSLMEQDDDEGVRIIHLTCSKPDLKNYVLILDTGFVR